MTRTIKNTMPQAFSRPRPRPTAYSTFIDAYNVGRMLNALKGPAPYEVICTQSLSISHRSKANTINSLVRLNI